MPCRTGEHQLQWLFLPDDQYCSMTGNKVKVYAPGSIGNVGSGFDVFGLAITEIGDTLEVEKNESGLLRIVNLIGDEAIPLEANKNIVTVGAKALLDELGSDQGFDFKIFKGVVAGSGLGSSASSATSGVFAVNELLAQPYTRTQLLKFAAKGEQVASENIHYDNVAPSLLGGFTVVRSSNPLEILNVDVPENLYLVLARPDVVIKTNEAKKMLSEDIKLADAVSQFGNIAGLIIGMQKNDISLIGRSVEDVVATPMRSKLIPKFNEARSSALAAGAAGFNISGSGPAMFAVCDGLQIAKQVFKALKHVYKQDQRSNFYIVQADLLGTRIIN